MDNQDDPEMTDTSLPDLILLFANTEIFHGNLSLNANPSPISILFKLTYKEPYLNFLLYDYCDLYFSNQTTEKILSLQKSLNSSLECSSFSSLIDLLTTTLINSTTPLKIFQSESKFIFEGLVNILNVKWEFDTIKIEKDKNYLAQSLFIKPINNVLLSLGQLINYENEIIKNPKTGLSSGISFSDALALVNTAYINQNRSFSKMMSNLLKESSIKVNNVKESDLIKKIESGKESEMRLNKVKKNKQSKNRIGEKAKYIINEGKEGEEESEDLIKENIYEENENDNDNDIGKHKVKKKKKIKFI